MTQFSHKVNSLNAAKATADKEQSSVTTAKVLNQLFIDSRLRVTYFDQITHDDAVDILCSAPTNNAGVTETIDNLLSYYGCKVATTAWVASFYGVTEEQISRACKY
ncbi:hypothetical protein QUB08_25295 [Microcoleus sp. BR0-C5]|uniref:hypothetical protein n=1 Tax=Microcoleus sp. BR0-C5 TaxID=2818713 RepID=UPI002FD1137E